MVLQSLYQSRVCSCVLWRTDPMPKTNPMSNTRLNGQLTGLNGQLTGLNGQLTGLNGQLTGLNGQLTGRRNAQECHAHVFVLHNYSNLP